MTEADFRSTTDMVNLILAKDYNLLSPIVHVLAPGGSYSLVSDSEIRIKIGRIDEGANPRLTFPKRLMLYSDTRKKTKKSNSITLACGTEREGKDPKIIFLNKRQQTARATSEWRTAAHAAKDSTAL